MSSVYVAILVLDEAQVVIVGLVTAGSIAVVNGDMAVAFGGSRCGTGFNGASWGEWGSVGQLLAHHLGFWGWQGGFLKQTTCSNKHMSSSSCNSVSRAVDLHCGLVHVWTAASEVSEVVWVLDEALVVVSEVAIAGITAVVGSDVVVATGGSGCGTRGWGLCRGGMDWLGSMCHHFLGVCSWVAAEGEVLVAVVDIVVNDDVACGGCANIINGVMSGNGGSGGSVSMVLEVD